MTGFPVFLKFNSRSLALIALALFTTGIVSVLQLIKCNNTSYNAMDVSVLKCMQKAI
jgi:hypothetical protein